MAKIFVSYSSKDIGFVSQVVALLKSQEQHEISVDVDSVAPGQNWRKVLSDGLKDSDVFVVFLSSNALDSPFVVSEIGAARAYAEEIDRMLIVPVIIDDMPIPAVVQDLLIINAYDRNALDVARRIEAAIARFEGQRAAKEKQQGDVVRRIEEFSTVYIDERIRRLGEIERHNRWFGIGWYVAGFVALVVGIMLTIWTAHDLLTPESDVTWLVFSILTFRSVIAVGLLGVCSKYAYLLGRSYMGESLKSADRVHAISFGKFYLRAYGAKATWPEIKEVFQHWNIDRGSNSFSSLSSSDVDSKVLEALIEIVRVAGGKSGN